MSTGTYTPFSTPQMKTLVTRGVAQATKAVLAATTTPSINTELDTKPRSHIVIRVAFLMGAAVVATISVGVFLYLHCYAKGKRQSRPISNKLRKPSSAIEDPESLSTAVLPDESSSIPPSHPIQQILAPGQDISPSSGLLQSRPHRGVVETGPQHASSQTGSKHEDPFDVFEQAVTRSSPHEQFRGTVRSILETSPGLPPPVYTLDRLSTGRTLRRMPRLEAIDRIYREQAVGQQSSPVLKPGPVRSLAVQSSSTVSAPLQSDDHDRRSIVSYTSEPVLGEALTGLTTSTRAAVVLDVDQGPAGEAQVRCTSRRFSLSGNAANTSKKASLRGCGVVEEEDEA